MFKSITHLKSTINTKNYSGLFWENFKIIDIIKIYKNHNEEV